MTTRVAMSVVAAEARRIEAAGRLRCAEPCTLILFGAGDLVHRKLMPALYHLTINTGRMSAEQAAQTIADIARRTSA